MHKLRVKICGLKDTENIRAILSLSVDYVGLIFYKKSKRYVSDLDTTIFADSHIKKVGVFVNSTTGEIIDKVDQYKLDVVQLHGGESVQQCAELKAKNIVVWKAFGIDAQFDFASLDPYATIVDHFLFDTKSERHGGTGKRFDWTALAHYRLTTPYMLSGGIGVDDLADVLRLEDDRLVGVDLNSKLELSPGLKDITLVEKATKIIDNEQIPSR